MRQNLRYAVLLVCLVAALLVPGVASAQVDPDGPTPPVLSDPDPDGQGAGVTNVAPHGGYSSSTDFCLQCHSVHKAPNATGDATKSYKLMRQTNVVAVCATCHSVFTAAATGVFDPGATYGYDSGGTLNNGTTATRAAYELASFTGEHTIGASTDPDNSGFTTSDAGIGGVGYGLTSTGGGLYCASCHTPHGDYGDMVNMWTLAADENTAIYFVDPNDGLEKHWFLDLDTTGFTGTGWRLCEDNEAGFWYDATDTLVDHADGDTTNDVNGGVAGDDATVSGSACIAAAIDDAATQLVSLYGYKLLSSYPNHSATLQGYNTGADNADGAAWCATCHTQRADSATWHNHPTGCDYCHGNGQATTGGIPNGTLTEWDFPHRSANSKFLYAIPDALCISCHTAGNLP